MVAAHACAVHDVEFTIYSKKRKSFLFGSQYLHEPIPGIVHKVEGEWVKYVNIGTPEEYRRKTHGKFWDGIVAPEDFETEHQAWNIREAYDRLWRRYSGYVVDYSIPTRLQNNGKPDFSRQHPYWSVREDLKLDQFDLVISTVPRNMWAIDGDKFTYSLGWALGDAPENGIFVPYAIDDMTILCHGGDDVEYNRLSRVFGYTTVEWPAHAVNIPGGANRIVKPLRYEPYQKEVWDHGGELPWNKWLHVGRYGKWHKGVLTTDAWHDVNKRLEQCG